MYEGMQYKDLVVLHIHVYLKMLEAIGKSIYFIRALGQVGILGNDMDELRENGIS